jgi:spore coat polysaccharide biosynthesis predicted glycosyltransferase SpsG
MRRYRNIQNNVKTGRVWDNEEDKAKHSERMLSLLNPMAGAIFSTKAEEILKKSQEERTSFDKYIMDSANAILVDHHKLSEKWVRKINEMVDKTMVIYGIPDPEHSEGEKITILECTISKVKIDRDTFSYAICENEDGWKYYFRSSTIKADFAEKKVKVSLTATVKGNADGITFLSRPHKIVYK